MKPSICLGMIVKNEARVIERHARGRADHLLLLAMPDLPEAYRRQTEINRGFAARRLTPAPRPPATR
ncbi:hypothetical protein ACF06X_23405 [Streptomyces sp. NPDC015346]|uniref:hypothetical protein n=1 Tax=Streptomyces sp. NPDC015346 TaxID=3364954 RepID=UPI0036F61583